MAIETESSARARAVAQSIRRGTRRAPLDWDQTKAMAYWLLIRERELSEAEARVAELEREHVRLNASTAVDLRPFSSDGWAELQSAVTAAEKRKKGP